MVSKSKATQRWEAGATVRIGGRTYLCLAKDQEPPEKGWPWGWRVRDEALGRDYIWWGYKGGLKLAGDYPLIRDREAEHARAMAAQAHRAQEAAHAKRKGQRVRRTVPVVPNVPVVQSAPAQEGGGLWGRLKARLGLRRQ
jgi:hypothetical protein